MFESTRDGNPEIYVMEPDGTSPQRLTRNPAQDSAPQWGQDAGSILFTSNRSGSWQLFNMNADGTGQGPIRVSESTPFAPRLSGDGAFMVFESFTRGLSRVEVVDSGGGDARNLTPDGVEDTSPAWSPDGTQLVVARGNPGKHTALYIVDVDTGDAQKLSTPPAGASDAEPDWSPSGDQIAFTRLDKSGNYDVYTMPAEFGATPRRLTSVRAEDGGAVWSPDGNELVFRSARSGYYELWKMNADGTRKVDLTKGLKGVAVAADWAPASANAVVRVSQAVHSAATFFCVTPPGGSAPTSGHDVVNGTPGGDFLCGGGGSDTIHGLNGNDQIDGGSGNDRLANQNSILAGDGGSDLIFARAMSAPFGDCDRVGGGTGLDTAWVDKSNVPCGGGNWSPDIFTSVEVTRPP